MALVPTLDINLAAQQTCVQCGRTQQQEKNFVQTTSPFFVNGHSPICNKCLENYLVEKDFQWDAVDRLCQWLDIPFIPKEFERLHAQCGDAVFGTYAQVFLKSDYEGLGWDDYFKAYKDLKDKNMLEDELPGLSEQKHEELVEKWGANYDDEALQYLEQLFQGLQKTQNVAGALQTDQAYKICKISYEIDCRIRAGQDFDKLLTSYDKFVKTAEFTPRNAKNASDFDSVGELVKWLERKGWVCKYYDNVTRDIVDETIKNIQAYNQRLYVNENGIGDEITRRIEALERAHKLEQQQVFEASNDFLDKDVSFDQDVFESEGYQELLNMDGDFEAEVEGYDR